MKKLNLNRRKFLKKSFALPLLASSYTAFPMNAQASPLTRVKGSKLKISLNAYSFNKPLREGKMDLFELLDFCANVGIDALDPTAYYFPNYPGVPDDTFIYDLKKKAFLNGLDISGTGIKNDFTVPDKDKRQADIQLIKNWIEVAAKLGAPVLRIFAGKFTSKDFTREQVLDWMLADIRQCVAFGKNHGVIVAVQNHHDFIKTAKEAIEIIARIDSEWFGLILDTGSFRTADPYKDIALAAPYAVNWQVKEKVYVHEEEQKTDLKKLIQIIKDSGYRGYLPIETLGEGDPELKVRRIFRDITEVID